MTGSHVPSYNQDGDGLVHKDDKVDPRVNVRQNIWVRNLCSICFSATNINPSTSCHAPDYSNEIMTHLKCSQDKDGEANNEVKIAKRFTVPAEDGRELNEVS